MGAPGYNFELWWGVLAPPKMPSDVAALLNADVNRVLALPGMKELFQREGAEPAAMSVTEFSDTIRREITGWKKVAAKAHIQAE